ncbi:uncharacterized protein GGS22DRAFT_88811 [Annulohypoxylon maeteangense]|uniref:uncharacterized protein n=1 Tax=Annulohypoxylon maeteangense TaxID=1927788 RepID=UPI002007AA1B|nr:uncharacterized protein GGS22DRAFT_88811 [Annulohypoxylon maeteangense]KAI0887761.1 hypothetical protein GGS22DRAFT_88811 [Annulohypoxylon maeteangense]
MGHKSKFTFPIPGRSSRHTPAVATSNPLSKAEKILGTGGANTVSPTSIREPGRLWETESNGGISISISESSTSQSGIVEEDDDILAGTNYGGTLWEEESEALPRRLRSANGPFGKGLKTKRSAATLGARSREATTDDSISRRPQSSSTVYSHYESAKMPLSISQQTSNSAMAKGLPSKAGALLDIDGALYGKGPQKKKPSKLDFSKLRLRSRKDQNRDPHGVGPVLGNNYVMRSPSVMSHMSNSLASSNSDERTPRPDKKITSHAASGRPSRLKGGNDASTLTQLYDHYEQMSFRHAEDLKEEDEEDEVLLEKTLSNQPRLLPRTYEPEVPDVSREDMITPLPTNARWTHSRNTSQSSKATATRAGTPSTLQLRPASRNDYPASISSRHTRTSKATPSIMSTLDSDRQQQSVLSLTDSESDEETAYSGPGSSLPSYENSFRDDASVSSSQRQRSASRLSISSHSTNPKGASYAQLNDFLTIPQASPKTKAGRSPSTNTNYSTNSSMSTATRVSIPSHPSQQEHRGSVSTTGTGGSVLSPTFSIPPNYKVQEARAITFTPLASTAEAASSVSVDRISNNLDRIISQQGKQRISQKSHASDQPTPPLSPTSIGSRKKSPEPARQESAANKASEPHNARLMAVTRQEEMLLAALRKKRARMRENIIAEIEEDRGHRGSAAGSAVEEDLEKLASANLRDAERQAAKETKEAREARTKAKQPKNVPRRASSLMRQSRPRDHSNGPRGADVPPSTSHSDPIEKGSLRLRLSPEPQTRRTGKSRHERVLLYLDRPIDSIDVIDQSEPSPDLSEFMEEDLDFPLPGGRQSRTRSKLGHYEMNGRPRPDSSPVSPRTNPMRSVPKIDPRVNEDIDADDFDDHDYAEEVADRRKMALPPVPEKGIPRPDSPLSPGDGLLSPSVFGHKKGKKSAVVRLSAVGQISSPIPWWGDDD